MLKSAEECRRVYRSATGRRYTELSRVHAEVLNRKVPRDRLLYVAGYTAVPLRHIAR